MTVYSASNTSSRLVAFFGKSNFKIFFRNNTNTNKVIQMLADSERKKKKSLPIKHVIQVYSHITPSPPNVNPRTPFKISSITLHPNICCKTKDISSENEFELD